MRIFEDKHKKIVASSNYNSIFNKDNGLFVRWGKDVNEDPIMAISPEILDLEISQGKCSGKCPECYKNNGAVEETYNMSFEDFRKIFHKVAKTVVEIKFKNELNSQIEEIDNGLLSSIYYNCRTKQDIIDCNLSYYKSEEIEYIKVYNKGLLNQIAFGICDIDTNPDFLNMMRYCKEFDIIPNFTFNGSGLTNELADEVAKTCGAVAISVRDKDICYNSVKMLTDKGMNQINFHCIAHDKSFNKILSIIDDIKTDKRLEKLNALVLLRYKPKGNGKGLFKQLSIPQYIEILEYSMLRGVNLGFDSCSAPLYFKIIEKKPELEHTKVFVEPCESSLFSSYINCKGEFYACSFCEKEPHTMWQEGIDVLNGTLKDAWLNTKTNRFRKVLLKNKRNCPMFNLDEEDL